jgi:sensor histidine kinase regulating citrate/malate metabolism
MMDDLIAMLEEFMPHWMLKMPRNLQMTIFTLVIVHLVILLSIVGYVMSGQYSRSGKADFKAKLK